jgi:hypothetical protein
MKCFAVTLALRTCAGMCCPATYDKYVGFVSAVLHKACRKAKSQSQICTNEVVGEQVFVSLNAVDVQQGRFHCNMPVSGGCFQSLLCVIPHQWVSVVSVPSQFHPRWTPHQNHGPTFSEQMGGRGSTTPLLTYYEAYNTPDFCARPTSPFEGILHGSHNLFF